MSDLEELKMIKDLEGVRNYLLTNKTYVDYVYIDDHPGNESRQVLGLYLFAQIKQDLEKIVKKYEDEGWNLWIIGAIKDVPAAYLYKEISSEKEID